MAAELNQEIFKVTKEESLMIKEVLFFIRDCRERHTNKPHCSQIGKAIVKIYHAQIEFEPAYYPGVKTLKG